MCDEPEVYKLLGLAYIEPELRENRGELEAAARGPLAPGLPRLISRRTSAAICTATRSPPTGATTIGEMAQAARELGYEYLAITDHSASHGFGNDVSPEELRRQIERVKEANSAIEGIELLAGSEVNILPDGSLDYEDDLLAQLDWVVASVHTSFGMAEQVMTERMITAIEHPLVDAIGHPTGRLIVRREPYAVDLEAVFAAAARTGTLLEINANPDRRDLSDMQRPRRRARGGAHRDRLRRPPHRHAGEHALGYRHGAAGLAEEGGRGQHAAMGAAGEGARQASTSVSCLAAAVEAGPLPPGDRRPLGERFERPQGASGVVGRWVIKGSA